MSKYEIVDTVKASLIVVLDHRVGLFKAALWPAGAMVAAIGIYFFTLLPIADASQNLRPSPDFGQVVGIMWPMFLALLPLLLAVIAFSFNWQRYLMSCDIGAGETAVSTQALSMIETREWWPDFWMYLFKNIQLFAVLMVPYVAFIWLFFASLPGNPNSPDAVGSFGSLFMYIGLYGIVLILLYPYVMRAMLVFPAIAAGLPDPTFRNAFDVSRGLGWYMVGAYLLSALAMQVIMMAAMIALAIVSAIIFGILYAIGGQIFAGLLGIVFFLLYPIMIFSMMAVYGSVPAFSLMQMIPDMNDRWHYFLDRRILGDRGADSDGSGGSPPTSYGSRKRR